MYVACNVRNLEVNSGYIPVSFIGVAICQAVGLCCVSYMKYLQTLYFTIVVNKIFNMQFVDEDTKSDI